MKYLISLNGDNNQVTFVRGNDGDICISFDIPSKQILWENVRVGVGNSGGQRVPGYVKDALIKVCEAMEKWERGETQDPIDEEKLDKLAREDLKHIIPTDYGTGYNEALILAYITGYRKAKKR